MKNGNGNGNGQAAGAGREERLQIMLSPEELSAVDNFRFAHRMPSRAAAVRELFRLGLSVISSEVATAGNKSSEYGVLRDAPNNSDGRDAQIAQKQSRQDS
jgi:hypothetical protein